MQSTFPAAHIQPADFRPHKPGSQVAQTVGRNPNPPAQRLAAPEVATTIPYVGESPAGFDPATGRR
jgi:hypothetical protein